MKTFVNPFCYSPLYVIYFIVLILAIISTTSIAKELITINEIQGKSERHRYTQELLIAVLDSTIDSHGEYIIQTLAHLNEPRTGAMLRRREGYGDIVQGATRKDWEAQLLPIKIPIMKGALGLRVLLIRKDMQPEFTAINSLEQLKQKLGGVTRYWSITEIFEHYKFNIVKTNRQDSMFAMLEKRRFDYVSRGINEILLEYQKFKPQNPNLHIETTLLVNIPLPVYFFVNPNKPHLAERIEVGLKEIINNGVLDSIFMKHFKGKFQQLNLLERKVFELKNPNLTSPHYLYKSDEFKLLFADK
jgi:ABC-type amino acid transport substrate-binding protein